MSFPVAVLASGRGSNLAALIEARDAGTLPITLTLVASDKADAALAQITSLDTMISVGDAALADKSAAEATQYTVVKDQMVAAFEDWCFDTARKAGDTGIVQTEYGYHVMYYVGTETDWMADAISALTSTKYADFIKSQEALPQFAIVKS